MTTIEQVLNSKNYYQLFGVDPLDKSSTEFSSTLKRQYKKLALVCHPDKSDHPQAHVAFQKVSRAFTVLNTEELKKVYDSFGDGEAVDGSQSAESVLQEAKLVFPGMPTDVAIEILSLLSGRTIFSEKSYLNLSLEEIESILLEKGLDQQSNWTSLTAALAGIAVMCWSLC